MAGYNVASLARLVEQFERMPGIGHKSAQRLAFYVLNMKKEDANVMALQFFAPIYLLLTVCDREPHREPEALQMLENHIRQFSRMYRGGDEDENCNDTWTKS